MVAGQSNKLVAIIQARMQSTRLPRKVLMPMPFTSNISILEQIVNQLKKSKFNPAVVVATSVNKADDEIVRLCEKNNILVHRGDEDNVLNRFLAILQYSNYSTTIRVTGDNPIIDIDCLDIVIKNHIKSKADYSFTSDLPIGMNFEVFDVKAFLKMSAAPLSREDKEHVTLKFKSDPSFIKNSIKIDSMVHKKIRVTVDYPSDYLVLSYIFYLSKKHKIDPGIKLIHFVLSNYPWVFQVNENNSQKKQFSTIDEEIAYSIDLLSGLDLKESAKYLTTYA
jgi:spore coat polysaccharide biosynthesis protein SpsF